MIVQMIKPYYSQKLNYFIFIPFSLENEVVVVNMKLKMVLAGQTACFYSFYKNMEIESALMIVFTAQPLQSQQIRTNSNMF